MLTGEDSDDEVRNEPLPGVTYTVMGRVLERQTGGGCSNALAEAGTPPAPPPSDARREVALTAIVSGFG